jgi:hypothetical protein
MFNYPRLLVEVAILVVTLINITLINPLKHILTVSSVVMTLSYGALLISLTFFTSYSLQYSFINTPIVILIAAKPIVHRVIVLIRNSATAYIDSGKNCISR